MTITAKAQLLEYVENLDANECCLLVNLIDIAEEQSLESDGFIKKLKDSDLMEAIIEYRRRKDICSCGICRTQVPSVRAAEEAGWVPELWEDENNPSDMTPVCPECVDKYCTWEFGELTIRSPGQFVC